MTWQKNFTAALLSNDIERDNTFRIISYNIANVEKTATTAEKIAYMRSFESATIPNVFHMQEVATSQEADMLAEFTNFTTDSIHTLYNTATATNEEISYTKRYSIKGVCDDAGATDNGLDRSAIVTFLQRNRTLLINHHMTFTEGAYETCLFNNLAAIVNAHTGPVVVTGDFNESDSDDAYLAFLSATGLTDDGVISSVDHIAYRASACSLSNVSFTANDPFYSDHGLIHADVSVVV